MEPSSNQNQEGGAPKKQNRGGRGQKKYRGNNRGGKNFYNNKSSNEINSKYTIWTLDFGASFHMTCNKNILNY